MIVTLTGDNAFMLGSESNRFIAEFTNKYGSTVIERIDGLSVVPNQLQSLMQSGSLFSTKRMLVVSAIAGNKQLSEQIDNVIGADNPDIELLFIESKFDKRSVLYKVLKNKTDFREFNQLDAVALSKWVIDRTKQQGGEISSIDAKYLVQRIGLDQLRLANELEKLITYNPRVNKVSIDELTDLTPQSSTFSLMDAAFAGDAAQALKIYDEQRMQKIEPMAVIGMIAWQLHVLALVKTAGQRNLDEIAREAKVNPFVVRKTINLARRTNLSDIKKLVGLTLSLDVRLKKDSIDADDAVSQLILEIAG